jgi:RNA polymerase sigma-70 factor, ECF subfamily
LVQLALDGDDGALRQLHDRYIRQVFQYAYTQTRDYHQAEEITQDIMYKMASRLAQFKGDSNFKTWLFTIGRRVVIDHYRKQ